MSPMLTRCIRPTGLLFLAVLCCVCVAPLFAQNDGADAPRQQSLLDLVRAAGWVGLLILLLSIAGVALAVNTLLALRADRLLPGSLRDQCMELAQRGRFNELLSITKSQDNLLSRTVAAGLDDGKFGVDAVREGMAQQGEREIMSLHQRVGYLSMIAAVAPLLGLLGTVTGMIASFNVLGQSRSAPRPEQLASGIAEALITTCMGLVLAVPMLMLSGYLRNRVTRVGQELAATCERLLRLMAVALEARQRGGGAASSPPAEPATAIAR